jgi:uncharacterized membrane protein
MTARDAALAEIRRLMAQHGIHAAELAEAPGEPGAAPVLPRVFAYLGGTFLCTGIAAFVALNWDLFPAPGRVLVTLGLGITLFIAAFSLAQTQRFDALPAPLYLLAELLQPAGMLVAFDEYGGGGDSRFAFLATALVFCVQSVAVYRARPHGVLLCFALLFYAWALVTSADLLSLDADLAVTAIGASLVLIALGLDPDAHPNTVRLWTLVGSALFYVALFSVVEGGWTEGVFVLAAVGGVYGAVARTSQPLLIAAIAALLGYISYFTGAYVSDALGWPLSLIIIGLAFFGLGRMTILLRARYFGAR